MDVSIGGLQKEYFSCWIRKDIRGRMLQLEAKKNISVRGLEKATRLRLPLEA